MRRVWGRLVLALVSAVWIGLAAPALAAPAALTLAQVSQAAEHQDLPVLRRALDDSALLASIEALDPHAAIELQLSIAATLEKAGDRPTAIKAYRLAVDEIGRLNQGYGDLTQVDPLRRIAALEAQGGDLAAAVDDIDRAFDLATAAKHPSLKEVTDEYTLIRAGFAKAHPGDVLPEPHRSRGAPHVAKYDIVEIYYATHRKPTGALEAIRFYGGERGPLVFGKALVSVPRGRLAGDIPKPDFWHMEFRTDPDKHVIMTAVEPIGARDAFFADLSKRVASSGRKEVFVFIHGFNTSFQDGAERTAQMAADLSIDGAPILYSWPSKANVLAYGADEKEVEVDSQIADLAQFLADVAQKTGASRVHLIAHSMGNRFLVRALTKLAHEPAAAQPRFDEVVMAAPDVGVDDFNKHWAQIRPLGRRFTLYASKRDRALLLSGEIHRMPRVGDAHKIVVVDGLQSIDTTAASQGLLGHTDFDGSALDDFRGVIWHSLAPEKRCILQTDNRGSDTYWVFAGPKACSESEFRQAVSLVRTAGSPKAALNSLQSMIADATSSLSPDTGLLEKVKSVLVSSFDQTNAVK